MWRFMEWVGAMSGLVVAAFVNLPQAGWAAEDRFAGVMWSVIHDPEQLLEHQAPMIIGQHPSADHAGPPSPAWLDLHGGESRAVNREPDLLRQEF